MVDDVWERLFIEPTLSTERIDKGFGEFCALADRCRAMFCAKVHHSDSAVDALNKGSPLKKA